MKLQRCHIRLEENGFGVSPMDKTIIHGKIDISD